jgi:hypothetical protein
MTSSGQVTDALSPMKNERYTHSVRASADEVPYL